MFLDLAFNSLVALYSKCCHLDYARSVWDEMLERDEVSGKAMISGFVFWGEVEKARDMFEKIPLRRNVFCWTAMNKWVWERREFGGDVGLVS